MDFREEKETTDLYLEELASWGMMLEEYRELSVKNCLLLNINSMWEFSCLFFLFPRDYID